MIPDEGGLLLAAGVDVGSSAAKVAVVEEGLPDASEASAHPSRRDGSPTHAAEGRTAGPASPGLPARVRVLAARAERIRRREPEAVATDLLAACLKEAGVRRSDLAYLATTGEGERFSGRTGHFYGMTAHARGALFLDPEARAVLDVGALHGRAVVMNRSARVLGHRMTSQCASGSGQFLENIGRYLGISIDEIGRLSRSADRPETCSSICAVLAETDVINMISRGVSPANIIKGIHVSMAGRYLKLLQSAGAIGPTLVTGGLAMDEGLMAALREAVAAQRTAIDVRTHPLSALAGALGAALWGAFRARRLAACGLAVPVEAG